MRVERVVIGGGILFIAVPMIFSAINGMTFWCNNLGGIGIPERGEYCESSKAWLWGSLPVLLSATGIAVWLIIRGVNGLTLIPFKKVRI